MPEEKIESSVFQLNVPRLWPREMPVAAGNYMPAEGKVSSSPTQITQVELLQSPAGGLALGFCRNPHVVPLPTHICVLGWVNRHQLHSHPSPPSKWAGPVLTPLKFTDRTSLGAKSPQDPSQLDKVCLGSICPKLRLSCTV